MQSGDLNTTNASQRIPAEFHVWLAAVLVIVSAFLCSQFFVQVMMIQGASMEPTFHNHQLVLLNKLPQKYEPGDVVAFRCDGLDATLVKRIVGIPGDTLQIQNGTLFVNGTVSTVYPEEASFSYVGNLLHPIVLDDNEYFVIGDNLEKSKDSRDALVGPVAAQSIIGLVLERK